MIVMLLVKVTLLLAATLAIARLLRGAPAVSRHRLWSGAFAAVLALPLLAYALPGVPVPVPAAWQLRVPPPATPDVEPDGPLAVTTMERQGALQISAPDRAAPKDVARIAGIRDAESGASQKHDARVGARDPFRISALTLIFAVWLAGIVAAAAALILSLLRVRGLARHSAAIEDPAWRHACDTIAAQVGLRGRTRLLVSARVATPMAAGVIRPAIFLPEEALAWTAERRDVVLAHELAHLASNDPLRHVVARLALVVYWFHPLAWIGARHAAIAREQACDQAVISLGARPSTYARVLLDFAESHGSAPFAALPIVEPSFLEQRLMAILNDDVRPKARRMLLVPALAATVLTLSLAAVQPGAEPVRTPHDSVDLANPEVPSASFTSPLDDVGVAGGPAEPRAVPTLQGGGDSRSACSPDFSSNASFHGSTSSSNRGGRTVVYEQIGRRGNDRVIQKMVGDLRVCMVAEDAGSDDAGRPSTWIGRARRVTMETQRAGDVQHLELTGSGGQRVTWETNGRARPFDSAGERWRDRLLAVLDTAWEIGSVRGQVSSLRGQISSIRGQRSSLEGEISSLHGEVSSMRGRISSIQGEESSLQGQISSIRGQMSSLEGAVSSERGAISGLTAGRWEASDADRARIAARVKEHEAEIARLETEIRNYNPEARIAAVRKEIEALKPRDQASAIESRITAFDVDGKVAAIQRRIADLNVDGRVAAIEREIDRMDADSRVRRLDERLDVEVRDLASAIAAVR